MNSFLLSTRNLWPMNKNREMTNKETSNVELVCGRGVRNNFSAFDIINEFSKDLFRNKRQVDLSQPVHSLRKDDPAAHGRFHIESIQQKITQKVWHLYKIVLQSANLHTHSMKCLNQSAKIV